MKKIYPLLLVLISLLSSCGNGDGVLLPTVTGAAYDLLVVGDPTMWKDSAGRALFDIVDEDTPGLPQSEPMFNVSFIPENLFDAVLRPARNILFFQVDEKLYTQGKVAFQKNKWAKIQAIVKISAPTQEEMIKVLKEQKENIVNFIVGVEYERSLDYYTRYFNGPSRQVIKDNVGITLAIPDFLNKSRAGENFAWVSNGSIDSRQDVVAYRLPYRSQSDFSRERLIAMRDSVLKIYIEGPSEGSYMGSDTINRPLESREMMVDGRYCVELRGLWRVQGDFMGGPFVSRSYYDEKHHDIVTVETFVYAPQHKKRNKIRLMEAITTSVEFE